VTIFPPFCGVSGVFSAKMRIRFRNFIVICEIVLVNSVFVFLRFFRQETFRPIAVFIFFELFSLFSLQITPVARIMTLDMRKRIR